MNPQAKPCAARCKNYAEARCPKTVGNCYTALPAPERLVLSTLDLLLVDDTDAVDDVESLRALRAWPGRPPGPGVEPEARDWDVLVLVPDFEAVARD